MENQQRGLIWETDDSGSQKLTGLGMAGLMVVVVLAAILLANLIYRQVRHRVLAETIGKSAPSEVEALRSEVEELRAEVERQGGEIIDNKLTIDQLRSEVDRYRGELEESLKKMPDEQNRPDRGGDEEAAL